MEEQELFDRLRLAEDDGGLSLAVRLRDRIDQLIDAGLLADGDRLPPERRMAEALSVSRPTVRQALEGLERRGSVLRRHGSGTYVTNAKIEGNLHVLSALTDDVAQNRRTSRTKVLQFGFCAPDITVQKALGVEADALSAVRLIRVRVIDDVPSTYEISWMPAAIAGHLVGRDLSDVSLFRLLAETADVRPDHGTERLRASTLAEDEARELECPVGTACFLVDRTTYAADGVPIEYATTLLRGDRFLYSTRLQAPARAARSDEPLGGFETFATDDR
ncbi:GntR family transcriptional regulator [Microbacterium caowuchunii]|uniref:GntR family transcriptional regulator n=1 Tax=Microbacterium caowuchunii TaxID=2614638 RepID=A0A5N0TND1_9MICO|nr:GntR family transcriptional regulator [Microbacterium caowuchunii]KAA9135406.1 GntR family transcriptional regulator [Microbacterium caowuchunii]